MKAPWPWGIAFWAFCTRLICGTVRRLFHIGEGSLGRIGNIAPSISDVIPMGSKWFALQGKITNMRPLQWQSQQPIRGQRPKTQGPGGTAGFAPKCGALCIMHCALCQIQLSNCVLCAMRYYSLSGGPPKFLAHPRQAQRLPPAGWWQGTRRVRSKSAVVKLL
jgi:hypothetical protein